MNGDIKTKSDHKKKSCEPKQKLKRNPIAVFVTTINTATDGNDVVVAAAASVVA